MGGGSAAKKDKEEAKKEWNEETVKEQLRDYFKAQTDAEKLQDFQMADTLGTGTYGRVRLAYNAKLKAMRPDLEEHVDGFFAIKILKKSEILRLKQHDHVKSERKLLLGDGHHQPMTHPFILKVFGTFKDERNLFMIMDFVPGGELLARCRATDEVLSHDQTRFYAAQIVMALQYLHAEPVIYRGLVPDNLLIDAAGYVKLVDFGHAKKLPAEELTYTLCGTSEYLAPEIVNSKGHGKGADWWALGIVIYEMLAGYPPFYAHSPFEIYQQILKAQPTFPGHFEQNLYEGIRPSDGKKDENATNGRTGLITRLLHLEVPKRIGCSKNGAEDIKKHKWFRGLNWAAMYNKQTPPPNTALPTSQPGDTSCYPNYPDSATEESGPHLEAAKQELFAFW